MKPSPYSPPRGAKKRLLSVRAAAAQLLVRLADPNAPGLDLLVEERAALAVWEPNDRRLAWELVFGVTRRRLWLEHILTRFMERPLGPNGALAHEALLCGLYQHAFLERIPAHAIVSEAVDAVRAAGLGSGPAGLVNAVLRRATALPKSDLQPAPGTPWRLAQSIPEWLSDEAVASLGSETEAADFFVAMNRQAPLVLRALGEHAAQGLAELAAEARPPRPGAVLASALVLEDFTGRPDRFPSFQRGALTVEDEGAQIAAALAGAGPGMRVLDLCAAPGGKTAHLAESVGDQGVVVASDVTSAKLDTLRETLTRLHLLHRVETKLAQLVQEAEPDASFDLVLVDAPCSAFGTLRRHPEARYRRSAGDVARLADVQLRLLREVAPKVKPGGILHYCVCTFTRAEGENVVDRFLAAQPGFRPARAPEGLPFDASRLQTDPGRWRTWTHRHGCDSFFIARLQRDA